MVSASAFNSSAGPGNLWLEARRRCYNNTFLCMEHVQGVTLENQWNCLNRTWREGVCEHLQDILIKLRQLRQDPSDLFHGRQYVHYEYLTLINY